MKTALITGVAGQDGAYLAQLLLRQGYVVIGTHWATGRPDFWRLRELGIATDPRLRLRPFSHSGVDECVRLLEATEPAEIYNFAGQSSAVASVADPHGTALVNGMAVVDLLESVRRVNPAIRFFQAGSAEMFGTAQASPQNEATPFRPENPYAVAKLFAHWACVNYRETHGIFACSGLLFNHESPLRGPGFVTRKITSTMAALAAGSNDVLELGNLDARRDWGYAAEFVSAMWRMLQAPRADAYVLATGATRTVREFATLAARAAGFDPQWSGRGLGETAVDRSTGRLLVRVRAEFFRPEGWVRVGDPAHAARHLDWRHQTGLEALCGLMVAADIARLSGHARPLCISSMEF